MIRISNGSVEVDINGKTDGRGAYLCRAQGCWEIGLKGSRLEHALRIILTQDNRDQLIKYRKDLTESISGKDK